MIITYDVAKKIKDIVSNDFDLYLHFHDSCGGQYFNFDEKPDDEVYTAIKNFWWHNEFFSTINFYKKPTLVFN